MNPVQRILVTGAGGFVCRNLVSAFLYSGQHVVAVDRQFDSDLTNSWTESWGTQIQLVETDVSHLPNVKVDWLIHGAAVTAGPEELAQTPEANFNANLKPFLDTLVWAEQQEVSRAIFISSSAVYRKTDAGPVTETMPASPYGLYAVAKYTMESLVETLWGCYKRDLVVVRLGNIYGPGEHARPTRPRVSLVGAMIQEALDTGTVIVPADVPGQDWTFAPDIGQAIMVLFQTPRLPHHLYHLAAGQAFTPLQIAQAIQRHLPGLAIEVRDHVPGKMPRSKCCGHLDSEWLKEDTGFAAWTDLGEGLRQTITWQRGRRQPTETGAVS